MRRWVVVVLVATLAGCSLLVDGGGEDGGAAKFRDGETVLDDLAGPGAIAADGVAVFIVVQSANPSGVIRWTEADGAQPLPTNGNSMSELGQAGRYLFAADTDGVLASIARVDKAGSGSWVHLYLQTDTPSNRALSVDGRTVVYSDQGMGVLNVGNVDGGPAAGVPLAGITGTAISGSAIYASSEVDGIVWRVDGNSPRPLASDLDRPRALAAHDDEVWVATGGEILEVSTGEPVTVASDRDQPTGLVADDELVYWLDSGSGNVAAAPHAGGQVIELGSVSPGSIGLAVDTTGVYVADTITGELIWFARE